MERKMERKKERKKVRKWKENQTSGRLQISGGVISQGLRGFLRPVVGFKVFAFFNRNQTKNY
jgi:hypothetical protein